MDRSGRTWKLINGHRVFFDKDGKEIIRDDKKLSHDHVRKPEVRFKNSQAVAKRRGLVFDLSFDEWCEIALQPCSYCNNKLGKSEAGVGLDRLDNSLGYTKGNVVPCCGVCNKMKNENLTFEEQKAAAQAILQTRIKIDLETIETLMKLMAKERIDYIEYGDIKITKSKHEMPAQNKDNSPFNKRVNLTDEELLFYSTTPSLTLKDIEDLEAGKLVINPTNKG